MTVKTPTFEEAIHCALLWCNAWDKGELSDEVFADRVAELLESMNGARGFFVVSLSSECPLMDRLPEPLIFKFREAKELVVDLTVKNLAMSSAMAIQHKRNQDESQLSGSLRISTRCIEILRLLDPLLVKKRIEKLLEGTNGIGEDVDFINRWGYDSEQKSAIAVNILSIPNQ